MPRAAALVLLALLALGCAAPEQPAVTPAEVPKPVPARPQAKPQSSNGIMDVLRPSTFDWTGTQFPDIGAGLAEVDKGTGRGATGTGTVTARMGKALPPEVVERILRQNFARYRLCYENGLTNSPPLGARIAVRFTIEKDGSVASAASADSARLDAGAVACVVGVIKSLTFPAPRGGEKVIVTYPIRFSPGNDSPSPPIAPAAKP